MNVRRLLRRVVLDPIDGVALVSTAVLATGVGLIFPPAALIVVGLLGLAYAVGASRGEQPPAASRGAEPPQ